MSARKKKRTNAPRSPLRPNGMKPNDRKTIKLSRSTIYVEAFYPDENPEGCLDEIMTVMKYSGLFEGIKQMDEKQS